MRRLSTLLVLSLAGVAPAAAQSYNAPALQLPVLADREYNFVASSGGRAGTALLFQWREGVAPNWQITAEAGLAAPQGPNVDTRILIGASAALQVARAGADFPFDVALTGGAGFSTGNADKTYTGSHAADGTVVRIPIGASVGHTFELEQGYFLTPFVHPRISLDRCSSCKAGDSDSKVNVDVDVGVSLQMTNQVAVRVAGLIGGTDYLGATNAIALSVAWTPKGLKK